MLTTYDMITGADFRVFMGVPRWEVLCVDEGQRRWSILLELLNHAFDGLGISQIR